MVYADTLKLILGIVANSILIISAVAGIFGFFKRWLNKKIVSQIQAFYTQVDNRFNHVEQRVSKLEGEHNARSDLQSTR